MEDLVIETRLRSAAGLPTDPLDDRNNVVAPIPDEGATKISIARGTLDEIGIVPMKIDHSMKPIDPKFPLPS